MKKAVVSWQAFALVCVLMISMFAYGMGRNGVDLREAKAKEATLQYSLTQLEQRKLALQNAIDNVGTDSYVEATAREVLDYMKPGELRFEIVNSEMLRNYLPEESQVITEELAWTGR